MEYRCRSYFCLPSIPWMLLVGFSLIVMCPWLLVAPHTVPLQYLGPVGPLYRFFERFDIFPQVVFAALCLHLLEACYSWHLCRRKGIKGSARVKWLVSTAVFGGTSLYELACYNPIREGAD